MYTKKQVIEQNIAIRATELGEAAIVIMAFPEQFLGLSPLSWELFREDTCYTPSIGTYCNYAACNREIISLSDISDIGDGQAVEEQEADWEKIDDEIFDIIYEELGYDPNKPKRRQNIFNKIVEYLKNNYTLTPKTQQ